MAVLVTGGAGFIGSHTCVELLMRGLDVVVVDDYSNSSPAALDAVRRIAGRGVVAYEMDLRSRGPLGRIFREHPIEAVIHFAAKKAVGESCQIPLDYYDVNVAGTINLLRTMLAHDVPRLVFSSSCSIYGGAHNAPIAEGDQTGPTNPYARSKLMCEQILADACARYRNLSVISLRYFNPIGAHHSRTLGETPKGMPNNVVPYMMQVALGRLRRLQVFGTDYDTPDGTGVRDYIHVMDVAEAHGLALDHLDDRTGMRAFNLGTGSGISVLQLLAAFQDVNRITVPYEIAGRRPGDVATLIADASRIEKEWGWRTTRDLQAMLRDAWLSQTLHPDAEPYGPDLACPRPEDVEYA
jgi:UDP-glucose 4-epimerase